MTTLFQVLYASAIGLMFGAVYARTRNIIVTMIVHSLIDISADFHINFYPELAAASEEITQNLTGGEVVANLALTITGLAVGFYLLRPSKRHEIESHWGSLADTKDKENF